MKKYNCIMYNMENDDETQEMNFTLEEVKPKYKRKSRAKPKKMETIAEEPTEPEQIEEDVSFEDSDFRIKIAPNPMNIG